MSTALSAYKTTDSSSGGSVHSYEVGVDAAVPQVVVMASCLIESKVTCLLLHGWAMVESCDFAGYGQIIA
jgi:hypothetical protein